MSNLKQIISYIKHPTFDSKYTSKDKIWNILKFWGFFLIFADIASLPALLALQLISFDYGSNSVLKEQLILPVWFSIISGVIFAPIREEATFRLWLKPSLQNLSLSLGFLVAMIVEVYIKLSGFTINSISPLMIHGFLIPAVASGLFYTGLRNNRILLNKTISYLSTNFSLCFWTSHIIFALLHCVNYDIQKIWYIVPILTLSQFVIGLYLGFLRINYGFKWSLVAHGLHNLSTLAMFTLISGRTAQIVERLKENNWDFSKGVTGLSIQDQLSCALGYCIYILAIVLFFSTIKEIIPSKTKGI